MDLETDRIAGLALKSPVFLRVSRDGDDYLAEFPNANLYGTGDTLSSSLSMLEREVLSLHRDLNQFPTANSLSSVREYLNFLLGDTDD